jgi:hypothetical protein
MYTGPYLKSPFFLSDFNPTYVWQQILEKFPNPQFHGNLSGGNRVASDGRADRQTNLTKLVVDFRNFANGAKNPKLLNTLAEQGSIVYTTAPKSVI